MADDHKNSLLGWRNYCPPTELGDLPVVIKQRRKKKNEIQVFELKDFLMSIFDCSLPSIVNFTPLNSEHKHPNDVLRRIFLTITYLN
jgi:hypothetical protein